jgi:hypothetical protein
MSVNERALGRVFYWLNGAMIIALLLWMGWFTARTIAEQQRDAAFREAQIDYIQQQNNAQLCAQHDIILAVRKTNRSLGLPVDQIRPPDIEGIECAP